MSPAPPPPRPSPLASASRARARVALGFFAGVRALFGGMAFVAKTPSTWGWALVPVVVAAALFAGASALAFWAGDALTRAVVDPDASAWHTAGAWALHVVTWAVGVVVAFVLAMSLAQPISGFALEAIARKQERALGGAEWPAQGFFAGVLRSLRVTSTALAMGLPVLALLALVSLAFPPAAVVTVPLKLLTVGWLSAYDLLDYPLSIRGEGVRARLLFMRANAPAVLGFGVAAAALLLIPGMGLLLLPWGAAGATRLVVERDRTP